MMRLRYVLCSAVAVCALSSCYSNFNQALLGSGKQYEGYWLDYHTDAPSGKHGLAPALYRCGNDWYMAGAKCSFEEESVGRLHSASSGFLERHTFTPKEEGKRQVFYHKITPEMAKWMMTSDQESWYWFDPVAVDEEMKRAGGEWLPALPAGAKAVPAVFLKYCRSGSYYVSQVTDDGSPTLAYPVAAIVFLGVDVPLTIASSALYPVVYVARALKSHGSGSSSSSGDDGASLSDSMDYARYDRSRDAAPPRHRGHHSGGGGAHHHGSGGNFGGAHHSSHHHHDHGSHHRHEHSSSHHHDHGSHKHSDSSATGDEAPPHHRHKR